VANSWEFPALIKFDVLPGPIRPFVGAGASFRHISGIEEVQRTVTAGGLIAEEQLEVARENLRCVVKLWASGRDHLDPRQFHVVWGLGHAFVRLRLVSRDSHTGDFDLVADVRCQVGGR
jgi:hypothetical protein